MMYGLSYIELGGIIIKSINILLFYIPTTLNLYPINQVNKKDKIEF